MRKLNLKDTLNFLISHPQKISDTYIQVLTLFFFVQVSGQHLTCHKWDLVGSQVLRKLPQGAYMMMLL